MSQEAAAQNKRLSNRGGGGGVFLSKGPLHKELRLVTSALKKTISLHKGFQ